MSAQGFKSVFMVGAIASAALGCYLVSLRVASERAALESVENKIVLAQRDIRLLSTEIGTRGRLAQLERWNVKVIRLSAPSADQFVESSFQLATLAKPEATPAVEAPIVYASAPTPARRGPVVTSDDGMAVAAPRASRPLGAMMHVAGYEVPAAKPGIAAKLARPVLSAARSPGASPVKVALTKPASPKAMSPKPAAAKPVKSATADPLRPLPVATTKAKSDATASATRSAAKTTKESGSR